MTKFMISRLSVLLILSILIAGCRKQEEPSPSPTKTSTPPQIHEEVEVTKSPEGPEDQTATPETAVDESVNYDWPPIMVYNSPAKGEEAKLDGPITIMFDQPMDQASVVEAFEFSDLERGLSIGGDFQWPSSDTLIFKPTDQLQREQLYEVQVAESARGRNGKPLREAVQFQMETVGFLEVSQTIPAANDSEIDADSDVTVAFNRPVVPLVSSLQVSDLPNPLEIEPTVEGQGEWLSTSIYRFTPNEPLAGATQYSVRIAAGLSDVTGGELDEDFTWRFSTVGPAIVSLSLNDGAAGVGPSTPISVTFNMPMDKVSTEAAISLNPPVPLNYEWAGDFKSVAIVPQDDLALDSDYELTVDASAQSGNGMAPLDEGRSIQFSTIPYPGVLGTNPANGQETGLFQSGASVQFASPMELESFRDQIVIFPEPEDINLFMSDEGKRLFIGFDLAPNGEYEITIPGSAADPYGNTLGADYTWRFHTPPSSPLVSFNLPFRVSQLSTSHPSDIDVIHRNVSQIDVELYEADEAEEALVSTNVTGYLPRGRPIRTWTIPVENIPELVDTVSLSLADGGSLTPGFYYLMVSAPEIDDDQLWWQNQMNLMTVGDSNLVVKEMFGEVHAWVTDMASGEPVSGAPLTLFGYKGQELGTATTDENGLASFPYQPSDDRIHGVLVVSQEPGMPGFGAASSSWNEGVSPWEFGVPTEWYKDSDRYGYLYTDRPIYRPGDTVHFKGIVRDKNFGRYPLPTRDDVYLGLDFISDYESMPWEFNATLDDNGEFSGQYEIPDDARLGNYIFLFKDSAIEGFLEFAVADYRKPEFLVTVTPAEEELIRGEGTEVLVEADFFFGGSADDLEVQWSVYEKPFWLPWQGPYYNFGDRAGFFRESGSLFDFFNEDFLGDYVTGGQGFTDSNGQYLIKIPSDLLDELDQGSRLVSVEATVFGDDDLPVSGRTSIIFHESETYVGLVASDYIGLAGTEVDIDLITVNWEGQSVPNQEIDIVFYHREWIPVQEEDFSRRFTRWEVEDTQVARGKVTTDNQGRAKTSFIPPNGGFYLAVATVLDDAGRTQSSSANLWVADSSFVGWRHDPRNKKMDLILDRNEYKPGEVANVLVQSPFQGPVRAWLTVERGDQLDHQFITLQSNSDILEVPITENYAPNAFVSVVAVSGINEVSQYADMSLGIIELKVTPEHLSLNVQITPREQLFSPGDTAAYDILVTDHLGNPVQAHFSIALVDLAVLTLKPDNATEIVEAFYNRQSMRSQIGSGLIVSGEGLEIETPIQILGRGGGGGGGAESASLSVALIDDDEVRQEFPDTAYWEAKISTDASGRASVEIPLPDSLTTWRLSSKAVSDYTASRETQVGQTKVDVIATLPLLIQPITPRFFTVGDQLQIGSIVHNNTGESQDITISLEAKGLTIEGPAAQTISLQEGERVRVNWPVTVDDVTFADLTFRAQSGDYRDATKPTFGIPPDQLVPVVRYSSEDFVGTSGILESEGRVVEALLLPPDVDERQGNVQVQLSPSLGAALLEILDYVNETSDRPVCAHAIADRLLPNAVAAEAFQRLEIDQDSSTSKLKDIISMDLQTLAELQKDDGGWGWCYSSESIPYLSAYTLLAIAKAGQAGFIPDSNMVEQAARYVEGKLEPADKLADTSAANRQAFYLYVLAELKQVDSGRVGELYEQTRDLLDPYAKALLLITLDLSGGSSADQRSLLADLEGEVILSATGAHWEDKSPDYFNLSSDIRGTAMVLNALARFDPDSILAPNAVRWLMSARTADYWSTGQQTAWTIQALTEWMEASREMEADYAYKLAVNSNLAADGRFDRETITNSDSLSIPVEELKLEDVNYFDIQRGEGGGRLYYSVYLNSFIRADNLDPVNRGVFIDRKYSEASCDPEESECEPIDEIEAGQQVRVELTIITSHDMIFAIIEDPIPSGTEAQDPGLETSAANTGLSFQRTDSPVPYGYWGWWYFNHVEYRDDRVVILSDFLPGGTYQYTYTLQGAIPGQFQVPPATARQEFFPEVFGRSSGMLFEINP
jgi:uncharacterized protein YfaS (alpha-2-macroglobulin family)